MTIQKKRKRESTKSERRVAARLGGRRVFNSGAGLEKGDGRVRGKYRIENKITGRASYTLTSKDWLVLWDAATSALEEPLFHVRMQGAVRGSPPFEVVIVPVSFYQTLFPESCPRVFAEDPQRSITISARQVEALAPYTFRLEGTYRGIAKIFDLVVLPYTEFLKATEAT